MTLAQSSTSNFLSFLNTCKRLSGHEGTSREPYTKKPSVMSNLTMAKCQGQGRQRFWDISAFWKYWVPTGNPMKNSILMSYLTRSLRSSTGLLWAEVREPWVSCTSNYVLYVTNTNKEITYLYPRLHWADCYYKINFILKIILYQFLCNL